VSSARWGLAIFVFVVHHLLRFFLLSSFFSSLFPLLPIILGIIPPRSGSFFALRYHFLFYSSGCYCQFFSLSEHTHCFYGLLIPSEHTFFNLLGLLDIGGLFFCVDLCIIFHMFTYRLFCIFFVSLCLAASSDGNVLGSRLRPLHCLAYCDVGIYWYRGPFSPRL